MAAAPVGIVAPPAVPADSSILGAERAEAAHRFHKPTKRKDLAKRAIARISYPSSDEGSELIIRCQSLKMALNAAIPTKTVVANRKHRYSAFNRGLRIKGRWRKKPMAKFS